MSPAQLDNRYAAALEQLAAAETKLKRAFTRWEKARQAVKRYERLIEKSIGTTAPKE